MRRVGVVVLVVLGCGCSRSKPGEEGSKSGSDVRVTAPAKIETAWGTDRVSLGPVFEGLTIGGPAPTEAQSDRWFEQRMTSGIYVDADSDHGRVTSLSANTIPELGPANVAAACTRVRQLAGQWSGGVVMKSGLDDHVVWFDEARHLRALSSFEVENGADSWCKIEFDAYVPAEPFISRDPDSIVPFDLIGKPTEEAATRYGMTGGSFYRTGVGPVGSGTTAIDVIDQNGTIVGLKVANFIDATTFASIKSRLTTLFGAPTEIKGLEGHGYRWPGPPQIRLVLDDFLSYLYIGGRPTPPGHGTWSKDDEMWVYHYDSGDKINYSDQAECIFVPAADDTKVSEVLCPPLAPDVVPWKR